MLCSALLQEHYLLGRWRDYPLLHFWTTMSQSFPEAQYLRATPCPLVTTLPSKYRYREGAGKRRMAVYGRWSHVS